MEGRELPVGWSSMELNDAGIWGSGGTPSRKNPRYYENGTIPWLVIGDLNDQAVEEFSTSITELGLINSSAKLIPTGSLLVAMYGSIGKLGITTFPCTTNQAIAFCIPNEELVELRYLFHALANAKPELIAKGQGGAQQNISQGILKQHLIPLSPLNEQRRIAAKLDTTLAAVDACRKRLDGVAAILKRFRQAVLAAATSGELTREWREERGKSLDDWAERSVGDVVTDIEAGLNVQCEERPPADNERGLVKISAVTWGIYDEDQSKTLKSDQQVLERNRIRSGDFLISRANTIELVGSCVIVHAARRALYLSDKVLRLVMSEEWKKWLLMCLRSDNGRRQIESLSSGNQLSMRNLSQKNLLSIKILLPPMDELDQIEAFSNQLLAIADQLEARLNSTRRIIDRLTPALLAKAFRGELVPQDPGDEPASVLLERIRAARQVEATAGKPSRRGRRIAQASPTKPTTLTDMLSRNDVASNHLTAILKECGPLSPEALWSASQLEIDDFYDQLRDEEAQGFLHENRGASPHSPRLLEPAA